MKLCWSDLPLRTAVTMEVLANLEGKSGLVPHTARNSFKYCQGNGFFFFIKRDLHSFIVCAPSTVNSANNR